MEEKKRPAFQIVAKDKITKENIKIGALWESNIGKGFNMTINKGFKLVKEDGTIIDAWLNVYDNSPRDKEAGYKDDGNFPF